MSRPASRSLPDGSKAEVIVTALERQAEKSMTPRALAKAIGCSTLQMLRYHMAPLLESGRVTVTGATANRLIHLGKAKGLPAAGPKPNGSMTRHTGPAASALDQILDRDRSVLGKINEAGPKGLSLRELGILLSGESEASLSSALTRLRVKRQIQADDNGKWVSA